MTLHVLIVDDEKAARYGMSKAISRLNCEIAEAADGQAALDAIYIQAPELMFLDLNMPGTDGRFVLERLSDSLRSSCDVIIVTADDTVESAVECMQLGASDYITKPFEVERLRAIVRRSIHRVGLETRIDHLQSELDDKTALGSLVGVSREMRQLFEQIARAADAPLDILICGETGTGKELIAREIHRLSSHAAGPFVPVNTAAVTEALAESELFGHAKGAFTGAHADRQGMFAQADGGTLFLDEIGDMPAPMQAKLLRVLQDRTIQPVGSAKTFQVDVRVVSATNQNLADAVEQGHFRRDLYYRLRGIELQVPPLRSRRQDILLLTDYFLDRLATQTHQDPPRPDSNAVDLLLSHHWPGNVRELEQLIGAAAAMAPGDVIGPDDLGIGKSSLVNSTGGGGGTSGGGGDLDLSMLKNLPLTEAKTRLVEQFERQAITSALAAHDGNVSAAARQLGIHRQNLQQKIKQLGIATKGVSGTNSD